MDASAVCRAEEEQADLGSTAESGCLNVSLQKPTNSIAAQKFGFLDCQHRAPKEVGSDPPAHESLCTCVLF